MSTEDRIKALTDRVQLLEASVNTLLQQISVLEANMAPTPVASRAVTQPTLTMLLENGKPLEDTYIYPDIRIGASLAEPTRWKLNGEEIGIFDYGWYNIDIPVGENTIEVSTLDGRLTSQSTFHILEE